MADAKIPEDVKIKAPDCAKAFKGKEVLPGSSLLAVPMEIGALAGLAGASLVAAGTTPQVGEDFGGTYGFTGIAVALLARNNALAAVPAALLFAALEQGGQTMEGTVGISSSLVDFIQGLMIVLVLAATTILYLVRRRTTKPRTPRAASPPTARPELEPSK